MVATSSLRVYLDHHIRRDNLLYRRPNPAVDPTYYGHETYLKLEDLHEEGYHSRAHLLRKPDFQRATWAWTPEDCVFLLESVLQGQVVPSVILWLSPDNRWYVLDGGHRISVVLARIKNDWGDRRPPSDYRTEALQKSSREAGKEVRRLLAQKGIPQFSDYLEADKQYRDLENARRDPERVMKSELFGRAQEVRKWKSLNIGFPILWVTGDYEKVQESFLRINKTGRRLSDWETTLVENRNSSFARAVMSISHVSEKDHYWPIDDVDLPNEQRGQVREILSLVDQLHERLFTPPFEVPIKTPLQPVFAVPALRPEQAAWLAELLTVCEGNRGQSSETKRLLKRDAAAPVSAMVNQGRRLLRNALKNLDSICGPSPRSLGLAPLVYFFNSSGAYVRNLLYGMVFWLNHGDDETVRTRKCLLSAHREPFENVLLQNKDVLIGRITRRIGSGPDVTVQTARYFDGLLQLLIAHRDDIEGAEFATAHAALVERLSAAEVGSVPAEAESAGRLFRGRVRTGVIVPNLVKLLPNCGICGGRFYPSESTQIDHKLAYARGGRTAVSNGQETHPFCNNNKETIAKIQDGSLSLRLPGFLPVPAAKPQQLTFDFLDFEVPGEAGLEDEATETPVSAVANETEIAEMETVEDE